MARVLEAESDLGDGLSPEQYVAALRTLIAPVRQLPAGSWIPSSDERLAAIGVLVVDGLLCRHVTIAGHNAVELIGPGDIVRLGTTPPARDASGVATEWTACVAGRLLVLDQTFAADVGRWPSILCHVVARAERRANAIVVLAAGVRSPRLERRVLGLMWHFAERWGHVSRLGVVSPLPVPQRILGDLVHADRSSVNRALRRLQERGAIERLSSGWRLVQSVEEFDTSGGSETTVRVRATARACPAT
jgi:hypothetical protein